MAKSRFSTPRMAPFWSRQLPPIQNQAPSQGSVGSMAALNAKTVFLGRVMWADGASHDIRSLRWRAAGAGLTGTLTVSLRDVDTAAGPPGRDDGTADQSTTHTDPASATNFTSTMSADRASVAHGALLACAWEVTAYTSGNLGVVGYALRSNSQAGYPQVSTNLSGSWASADSLPLVTLVAADGTLGILAGALPQSTGASITTQAFNSGSTPDEYALAFTPSEPTWCGGFDATVLLAGASSDFDVVLYEGTTVLETRTVDAHTPELSGLVNVVDMFPDVEFDAGTTYYLSIKPTSANNVTVYLITITSGDADLIGDGMMLATRTDAGAWTTDATRFPLALSFAIVAADDGAGSGGGGLLTHPGMSGGMRG